MNDLKNSVLQSAFRSLLMIGVSVVLGNIFAVAQGGAGRFRFDSYTTDDGLPQNGVRGIVQTPDGYLWFTTFDGLVRYDGVKFTVFDKNNTKGINSNRFSTLYMEADGTLLAGTEDGGLTVYRNGSFETLTTAEGLPSNAVTGFRFDVRGEIYVATAKGNVYLRNGKLVPVDDIGMPDNNFSFSPSSENIWFYQNDAIQQITATKERTSYAVPIKFFNETLSGIRGFEDSKGNFWLGDLTGIYCLTDGRITHLTAKDGVPEGTLLRPFTEDVDGGIWFSSGWANTRKVGIVRYLNGSFTTIGEEAGISSLSVSQIFKDREKTLWVASDKGLNHLRRQLFASYSTKDGLAYNEVYPLLQSSSGDIYVGTTRGLNLYRDGKFTEVPILDSRGGRLSVTSLFEDDRKRLWIGSLGDLYVYENGKLTQIPEATGSTTWDIADDRNGDVWAAGDAGIFRFRDDRLIEKFTVANGLPNNDVKVIHQDRNGAMWFGTYGGLVRYVNGNLTAFTTADGLASDRVRSIYEDEGGTLWIGTYDGGLSRFRDDKFFNYSIENGLFNNGVFQILEDAKSNFWISCNRGIYRVTRAELDDLAAGRIDRINSVAYGRSDGMLNTEANGGRQPAGIKAADGRFWFPTQDGVVVMDPAEIEVNLSPPKVKIESVTVERQEATAGGEVQLKANSENLEIHFTGITFIKPEQVKFRYRIEGLDENWTDAGTRRNVYYTFLPAGEYIFHVTAANSDGVWNENGATFKIRVNAPLWQRWWFIVLEALVLALIVYFVYRRRIIVLERENFQKETFARQLIESQESERRRIAAELHDSLGQSLVLIKNWALLGLRAEEKQQPTKPNLDEISDTATDAINEVREIAYNLGPYQLERLGMKSTIVEMIQKVEASSGTRFNVRIDEIEGLFDKDAEVSIFRIVQETVSNIVKHSGASTASVSLLKAKTTVTLTVTDDGNGFEPEVAGTKRGFGLLGMTERVSLLGGEIFFASEIGKGTTVKVTLPC